MGIRKRLKFLEDRFLMKCDDCKETFFKEDLTAVGKSIVYAGYSLGPNYTFSRTICNRCLRKYNTYVDLLVEEKKIKKVKK